MTRTIRSIVLTAVNAAVAPVIRRMTVSTSGDDGRFAASDRRLDALRAEHEATNARAWERYAELQKQNDALRAALANESRALKLALKDRNATADQRDALRVEMAEAKRLAVEAGALLAGESAGRNLDRLGLAEANATIAELRGEVERLRRRPWRVGRRPLVALPKLPPPDAKEEP
jgi:hypothetical protein